MRQTAPMHPADVARRAPDRPAVVTTKGATITFRTYKRPRSIDFERGLPRLDTGKLNTRLLRDRYWKDR